MKHLGDISKINGADIEPVDIITFGSPCQDLSVAGKRAGLRHEANGDEETTRSGLFMEAVRIIKEMREATNGQYPTYALWENVPGAFSSNKGEDFRVVLEELIKIAEPSADMPAVPPFGWAYADSYVGDGWSLAYRVFDTQYWPRTPQRRRRIYLVADFGGQRAREILFEREGLRGHLTESPAPRERITAYVEVGAGAANQELTYAVATQQGGAEITDNDVCPTITAAAGMSGNSQPWIVRTAAFKAGQGVNARGIGWEEEKSPTLASEAGGNSVPSVCVKTWDARGNGDGETVSTITGDHENRITDYSSVVVEPIPIHDQATRFSGKRGDRDDGKGNGLGIGSSGDPMNTLTSGDRHAVAFAMQGFGDYKTGSVASGMKARDYKDATDLVIECMTPWDNQARRIYSEEGPFPALAARGKSGQNQQAVCYGVDCRNATEYEEMNGTLQAKNGGGFSLNCNQVVRAPISEENGASEETIRYIVRRLTPTECARLQGFGDKWGHPDQKEAFTDEEHSFWLDVRNTHAAINGKAVKEYTKEQMLKWYNKLHSDSAEYKMWGNGIALPPTLYCMQGVTEALNMKN